MKSPNIGNKTKYINNAELKIFYLRITPITNGHLILLTNETLKKDLCMKIEKKNSVRAFFQGRSGKKKQIKF